MNVVVETHIGGLAGHRGKVRDIYDLGERLLIVACDRISAFDVVLPTPIPEKGCVLTRLSKFWFERFGDITPHHMLEVVETAVPAGVDTDLETLAGRAMLCRKCKVVPIECVVRGYLAGSGWKEYQRDGAVCGVALPPGLTQCAKLPEPIFTPSTKAEVGHDENISFDAACDIAGRDIMQQLRDRSLAIYRAAAEYAAGRGVIIADTKFEWGLADGELVLIDEVLTPDSSRFWPAGDYAAGRDQDSFDKQYVRNHLQQLCDSGAWDKTPPGPALPDDVVAQTTQRYIEAYERLVGQDYPARA